MKGVGPFIGGLSSAAAPRPLPSSMIQDADRRCGFAEPSGCLLLSHHEVKLPRSRKFQPSFASPSTLFREGYKGERLLD